MSWSDRLEAAAGQRTAVNAAAGRPETSAYSRESEVFHTLAILLRCPVITADGEKRPIQGFLFDDQSWLIRYLIVDAGNWLAPRPVVVSTAAVAAPDWKGKCVHTQLTVEQLLGSPPAETVRPVSRQQELAWSRHFGWPEGKGGWHFPSIPARREFGESEDDDPHLRRAWDLRGYEVWGNEGAVGHLDGYLVGERSWHIGYLAVRATEWVRGEQLISTEDVCGISWAEHRVWLRGALDAPRGCEGDPAMA